MSLIYYITQVQFDFGALQLLRQECERSGITRPLIVTDPGVVAAGIVDQALRALANQAGTHSAVVFDQTPSNPTEAAVRAAANMYKQQGCDGLIAVGGGSAIDCAKGVAIAATHEGPLKTYATIEGGSAKISERVAPLIAVPPPLAQAARWPAARSSLWTMAESWASTPGIWCPRLRSATRN